ncbi:MAG: hypothetical protein WC955_12540 [Elusimicrobiota bacterium]
MNILKVLFTTVVVCPECRTKSAKKYFSKISCLNHRCSKFDQQYYLENQAAPRKHGEETVYKKFDGSFEPEKVVVIRYRNYQGDDREFRADANSLQMKKNHVSVCVAPTGERLTLSRDYIQNITEVERLLPNK